MYAIPLSLISFIRSFLIYLISPFLSLYQVHAVTEGTDAQATVSVKIEENDRTTVGQSADTDTLVASANAYLNALNKMLIKREKKSLYKNIEPKKLKESI